MGNCGYILICHKKWETIPKYIPNFESIRRNSDRLKGLGISKRLCKNMDMSHKCSENLYCNSSYVKSQHILRKQYDSVIRGQPERRNLRFLD